MPQTAAATAALQKLHLIQLHLWKICKRAQARREGAAVKGWRGCRGSKPSSPQCTGVIHPEAHPHSQAHAPPTPSEVSRPRWLDRQMIGWGGRTNPLRTSEPPSLGRPGTGVFGCGWGGLIRVTASPITLISATQPPGSPAINATFKRRRGR